MPHLGALQQFRWGQIDTGYAPVSGRAPPSPTSDKDSEDGLLEKGKEPGREYSQMPVSIWRNPRFLVGHTVLFCLYILVLSLVAKSKPECVRNQGLPHCEFDETHMCIVVQAKEFDPCTSPRRRRTRIQRHGSPAGRPDPRDQQVFGQAEPSSGQGMA